MKAEEIRRLSAADCEKELDSRRKALLNLRCRGALGESVNSAEMTRLRREIARILTVQRETAGAANRSAGE